jgi:hypothetical protein
MAWRRLGNVFCPAGNFEWMFSHAANPFAEHVEGSEYRVYFSCRDRSNRSSVASLMLDLDSLKVRDISTRPVLTIGDAGHFDDNGISMACIVPTGDCRYLYYVGWNLCVTVPFRNSIGLAVSTGGGQFEKYSPAPVLDRSTSDPLSLSYPWVLKEGSIWKMWYGSTVRWRGTHGEQDHVIKYAESSDGIHWQPTGDVCLAVASKDAYAHSRPCVVAESGRYKMWFSYRGEKYRIGYAESRDGIRWKRKNGEQGLEPAGSGWDSQSVEYAHVVDHAGQRFALYCGDGYGATGFGLAVWEEAPS